MLLRLFLMFVLAAAFSGCASTQLKTENDQLQARVTDLEKDQQAKDSQIVDLQYQVKDLSSKVDAMKAPGGDQVANGPVETEQAVPQVNTEASSAQIIRVKVGVEKIQRALKSAGVYTGPVDGKAGAGTKEAIIEFQKSHGLKADGVLGKKTWDKLKAYLRS
ncbi:MAG: peptidoglycan-binding protein [Candidatus Omnitrophica bacterium]|nr:peptidoglycan-binding protein [Candidatus Omnitrophota bacterium]MDE2221805.1 peptidoglycan-binding protein [Candidatus Omnitrophota bacterium]